MNIDKKLNRRKTYFFVCLLVSIGTIFLLVTGSSLLTLSLNSKKTIPFGTLITWAGMVSLPLTIYYGMKEFRKPTTNFNKILAGFLKVIITLGILWVPISFLLAGNLSFSFSEKETFQGGQTAMKWFWSLSYAIVIGTILNIVIYWISLLFKGNKKG